MGRAMIGSAAMAMALTAAALTAVALAGAAHAQNSPYGLYGNGPVVIVQPAAPGVSAGASYGYGGTAVLPNGNGSGVVVTPGGAIPYGRYNKDTAREAFRLNNAIGGAQAANEAAARAQQPMTPLNPMPGGLR
jgi:hypothetical protein